VNAPSGGARHRGREVALQVLFAIDLAVRQAQREAELAGDRRAEAEAEAEADDADADGPGTEAFAEASFERVVVNFEVPSAARTFARGLVVEVCRNGQAIDVWIAAHARNWRVSRMAAVDRNILRLGTYELAYTDTPVAVIVDEAVGLAQRFGSDPSPAFVNGILDAIAREVRAAPDDDARGARGADGEEEGRTVG